MAKILYGNGECDVDATDIIYCELRVKYPIEIDDKSPDGFIINARNNKIIIAKLHPNMHGKLAAMFHYVGELNILSAALINTNGDIIRPTIKRVMDYAELLTTKAEDMTNLSENLSSTYVHKKRVTKMKLLQPYVENLTTTSGNYYLKGGTSYSGAIHISHEDGSYFTGGTHDDSSMPLYFRDTYKGDVKEELTLYTFEDIKKSRRLKSHNKKIRKKK